MTGLDPALVRKAAAFVTKLDALLDEFGIRVDGTNAIEFSLIGLAEVPEQDRPRFQAVPSTAPDKFTPTALTIGFPS